MISATRSIAPARTAATPLPWVQELQSLYNEGLTLRQGQLIMIAGFPGSMKSAFAMWMANLWNLPTLYFSADMSNHDAVTRLGSIRTPGTSHTEVGDAFSEDNELSSIVEENLSTSRMQFVYDDAPSLADIEEELAAWVELFDEYPSVVIVDNLIDLDLDDLGMDEFRAWLAALLWFKSLCREHGITVIVLHHARELSKSDFPAARKDIQGKISQTPEVTLTVSLTPAPHNEFRIAIVKSRGSGQDPMARRGVQYRALASSMSFKPDGNWELPQKNDSGW